MHADPEFAAAGPKAVPASWPPPTSRLALASLVVAVIAIALPYSPVATPLGLVGLPLELLVLILAITVGYVVVTELVKLVFWRRSNKRTVAR